MLGCLVDPSSLVSIPFFFFLFDGSVHTVLDLEFGVWDGIESGGHCSMDVGIWYLELFSRSCLRIGFLDIW